MKRVGLAAMLFLVLGIAPPAQAVMLVHLIDFGAPGLGPGDTGSISVLDDAPPPWTHDIRNQLPSAAKVEDAALAVSYRGTDGNELGTLVGDGVPLGSLLPTGTPILTTTFSLGADALAALQLDGLLAVTPVESTAFRDGFRLYASTLSVDYSVIPELPACLLLILGCLLTPLLWPKPVR